MLLLLLVVAAFWGDTQSRSSSQTVSTLKELSAASRDVARAVGPSVVRIDVERDPTQVNDELERMFGGTIPVATQGSGIVVSDEGHILTSYHVVSNSDRIVVLAGSEEHVAKLIGFDALTDVALLHVDELTLPEVQWGDSDQVEVGDFVWAIGNPFGLQRSVTFGIISAVEQEGASSNVFQNFFQTDAALNPGSSGGPLANVSGEVVGVNTAIIGNSFRGISFALPGNAARDIVEQLRASGRVKRGWIGVRLDELTNHHDHQWGMGKNHGALVSALSGASDARTPARSADIRIGDVITHWDNTPITSSVQLGRQVARTEIGKTIRVNLIRNGRSLTVKARVGERPR